MSRKFRFADVGKSELGKKERETCAKHKIDRSQNGRSINSYTYGNKELIPGK